MLQTRANWWQPDVLLLPAEPQDATTISAARPCRMSDSSIQLGPTSRSSVLNPIAADSRFYASRIILLPLSHAPSTMNVRPSLSFAIDPTPFNFFFTSAAQSRVLPA
jgi:hypothetical protein